MPAWLSTVARGESSHLLYWQALDLQHFAIPTYLIGGQGGSGPSMVIEGGSFTAPGGGGPLEAMHSLIFLSVEYGVYSDHLDMGA